MQLVTLLMTHPKPAFNIPSGAKWAPWQPCLWPSSASGSAARRPNLRMSQSLMVLSVDDVANIFKNGCREALVSDVPYNSRRQYILTTTLGGHPPLKPS